MDTIVRFEGRTTSGYKPHKVDVDDPSGGRHDLPEEVLKGHYAELIMPHLTPLPFPTVLLMVRADPLAHDRTRLFCRIYGPPDDQLGRASCRARVCPYVSISVVPRTLTTHHNHNTVYRLTRIQPHL